MEAELQGLLDQHENVTGWGGCQVVVRNGHLLKRDILTGLGLVPVRISKVRDRSESEIKFNSALVPPPCPESPTGGGRAAVAILHGMLTGACGKCCRFCWVTMPKACRPQW